MFDYYWNVDTWSDMRMGNEKNRTRQQDISCVGSVYSISFHWVRAV